MHSMAVILTQAVPEGRLFGLDQQTLISMGIQLLNGIILSIALGTILYKPVKEFMQKRSDTIQNKMDEADTTMSKANSLIAEYDMKINNIEKERIEILEAAHLKSEAERKTILEEARKEAAEIKKRSLISIEEDKKRVQEESRTHIIELSCLIAEKYISENISHETLDAIFDETLVQLEATQWKN